MPNAQLKPANKAIHSTVEEGKKIPFSKPTMISKPINPSKIDTTLLNVKTFFKNIFAKIVPQIGHR